MKSAHYERSKEKRNRCIGAGRLGTKVLGSDKRDRARNAAVFTCSHVNCKMEKITLVGSWQLVKQNKSHEPALLCNRDRVVIVFR